LKVLISETATDPIRRKTQKFPVKHSDLEQVLYIQEYDGSVDPHQTKLANYEESVSGKLLSSCSHFLCILNPQKNARNNLLGE